MSKDDSKDSKVQFSDREALFFHSTGRPGKIESGVYTGPGRR
jgi:malate dehydrogenase (oxaloacetate-decarboxylating)(NADP+)